MTYLLDADWAISFLNGRSDAVDLVGRLADAGIAMSIIACGEIYEGLVSLRSPASRLAEFDAFTNTVDLIAPDTVIARQYAAIRSELRSRGLLIPDNDCWIAATALARDLTLVTRDEHFSCIPHLKLHESA